MSHSKYWKIPDKQRACSFSVVLAYLPFTHYTLFICKPCTIHAQYIPYSSHNSHSNKLHRLLMHTTTSAYKLNCIILLISSEVAAIHNTTHSSCTTTCTTHPVLLTPQPSTCKNTLLCTQGWFNGTRCIIQESCKCIVV